MNTNTYPIPAPPVIAEFTRGGIIESRHRGYICVADQDGRVVFHRGDPNFVTFLRSSAKPLQAAAMVLCGAADAYHLTGRELALVSGSHGGELMHTEIVLALLRRAGLEESDLKCGVHPPLDAGARAALDAAGVKPTQLHHNCSGKHTGMLLSALHLGASIGEYLQPSHPVQKLITEVVAETCGVEPQDVVIGIDGCSAPVHGVPMKGIATAFARLVRQEGVKERLAEALDRVGLAMRANPEMVAASTGRICTELIRYDGGLLITAKAGAEGVYGVGWKDSHSGRALGLAIKVEDGAQRGRDPVIIGMMQRFGALPKELPASLTPFASDSIKNWRGVEVGESRAVLEG